MQPSECRANEPFAGDALRFVRPVRQPESRFKIAAEARGLGAGCPKQRVKVLIGHKPPQAEESRVGPTGSEVEIHRAGAGLQACREPRPVRALQIGAPGGELRPERYRRLRGAALRVPSVEAVLCEDRDVAEPCPALDRLADLAGVLEVICHDRSEDLQVKIRMKTPGEIEFSPVGESRARRGRESSERSRHFAPGGEYRVVGNQTAAGKKRRGGLRRGALRVKRGGQAREQSQNQSKNAKHSNLPVSVTHDLSSSLNWRQFRTHHARKATSKRESQIRCEEVSIAVGMSPASNDCASRPEQL